MVVGSSFVVVDSNFVVFGLQITLSLLAYALIAAWFVAPRLAKLPLREALLPLVMVHLFRYVALTLITPSQVSDKLPDTAAHLIAYGDVASSILAFIAAIFLRYRLPGALLVTWLFAAVSLVDLVDAFIQGVGSNFSGFHLGFNWYVITFYVPALIVTTIMVIALLVRRNPKPA
jgi:hypothetical protein